MCVFSCSRTVRRRFFFFCYWLVLMPCWKSNDHERGFFITDPYAHSYVSAAPSRVLGHTLSNFAFFFQTVLAILGPLRLGHLAHLCKGIAGLFVHWWALHTSQASIPPLSNISDPSCSSERDCTRSLTGIWWPLKEHCHPGSTKPSTLCLPCAGPSATFCVLSLNRSTLHH